MDQAAKINPVTKAENDILERLFMMRDARDARAWMQTPHPLLGYKSPNELIKGGRLGEVDRIVKQMEDGTL